MNWKKHGTDPKTLKDGEAVIDGNHMWTVENGKLLRKRMARTEASLEIEKQANHIRKLMAEIDVALLIMQNKADEM